MGDLTLSDFQEQVLLVLGNIPSAHPVIAAGMHTKAINDAANDLIRIYPEKFPEHQNNSWTTGLTTVGENKIALPDNMLVLERVQRPVDADATTNPAGWEDTNEMVVSKAEAWQIGIMSKESSDTGYPRLYVRSGSDLLYHPPTRTGFTTYLRIYGLAGEERLSAPGETFLMHRDFDEAIVLFAASKVAMLIPGMMERSRELKAEVRDKMAGGLSVVGREAVTMCMQGLDFGAGVDLWGGRG